MQNNIILQGDALAKLKKIPDESIDCIITSPPYYGLRDYEIEGQLGQEKTMDDYLNNLLGVTYELKRVLKKDGTMFWNHGDSYAGSGKGYGDQKPNPKFKSLLRGGGTARSRTLKPERSNIPQKSLMLQAHRLAIKMVDKQKWILRNQIIWHKPNCMPSSVKDRFTVDFEPVFFFSKSKKYWFEQQKKLYEGSKNKRTVWKIATQPMKEAHIAMFPEKLVESCIKSGCKESGIVLDPFFGSGTTGLVARKLGRNYIGIELSADYIKVAEKRLSQKTLL